MSPRSAGERSSVPWARQLRGGAGPGCSPTPQLTAQRTPGSRSGRGQQLAAGPAGGPCRSAWKSSPSSRPRLGLDNQVVITDVLLFCSGAWKTSGKRSPERPAKASVGRLVAVPPVRNAEQTRAPRTQHCPVLSTEPFPQLWPAGHPVIPRGISGLFPAVMTWWHSLQLLASPGLGVGFLGGEGKSDSCSRFMTSGISGGQGTSFPNCGLQIKSVRTR